MAMRYTIKMTSTSDFKIFQYGNKEHGSERRTLLSILLLRENKEEWIFFPGFPAISSNNLNFNFLGIEFILMSIPPDSFKVH